MIFGLYEIGACCDKHDFLITSEWRAEHLWMSYIPWYVLYLLPLIWSAPHKIVSCLLGDVFLVLSAAVQGTVSFPGKLLLYSNFAQQIYIGWMEMRSSMQSSASVDFLSIERIKIYCTNWSTHEASCCKWWCFAHVSCRQCISVLVSTVAALIKFNNCPTRCYCIQFIVFL